MARAGNVTGACARTDPFMEDANRPAISTALVDFAMELTRLGRSDTARVLAAKLLSGWSRAEADPMIPGVLCGLAATLLQMGHAAAALICIDEAIRLVGSEEVDVYLRDNAWSYIAAVLARANGLGDPVAAARRVTSAVRRARALVYGAEALTRESRLDESFDVLAEVATLQEGHWIQPQFVEALLRVAIAADERSLGPLVERVITTLRATVRRIGEEFSSALHPNSRETVAATFDWIDWLVKTGRPTNASDLFVELLDSIWQWNCTYITKQYLVPIAEELTACGLDDAAAIVRALPVPEPTPVAASANKEEWSGLPLLDSIKALEEGPDGGIAEVLAILGYGTASAEAAAPSLGVDTLANAIRIAGWTDPYWRRLGVEIVAALAQPAATPALGPRAAALPSRQHVSQCAHTISAVLHGLLGDVHRDRADWRVAIDEYRLAVAVDPARSDWLTREGWCEVAAGRITYALAIFERLAHEWSDDSTGDGGKGRCLLDLGDVEGAVASLSRAVAKNESWVYWRALANLARSAHAEFDDDLRRDEACAPDPLSDAVRHFWRAVAHDVAGRTEEVRAHLEASRSRMDALAPVPRQKLSGLIAAYDGNAAEARVGLEACFAVPEERGHSAYRSYLRLLTRILPQRPDLEETRAWFESRCPHLEESS